MKKLTEKEAANIFNKEFAKIKGKAQQGAFKKGFNSSLSCPNPYTADKWAFYSAFFKGQRCKKIIGTYETLNLFA